MRDPGAIVTVAGFAFLVGAHARQRLLIRLRIALDRDLRRHAADRESSAPVAGLDHEQ